MTKMPDLKPQPTPIAVVDEHGRFACGNPAAHGSAVRSSSKHKAAIVTRNGLLVAQVSTFSMEALRGKRTT